MLIGTLHSSHNNLNFINLSVEQKQNQFCPCSHKGLTCLIQPRPRNRANKAFHNEFWANFLPVVMKKRCCREKMVRGKTKVIGEQTNDKRKCLGVVTY